MKQKLHVNFQVILISIAIMKNLKRKTFRKILGQYWLNWFILYNFFLIFFIFNDVGLISFVWSLTFIHSSLCSVLHSWCVCLNFIKDGEKILSYSQIKTSKLLIAIYLVHQLFLHAKGAKSMHFSIPVGCK